MLTEFKTQLVATLEADATLTALLASSSSIFQRRPDQAAGYPLLFYEIEGDYDTRLNAFGKVLLDLRLMVDAEDPDVLDSIEEALRALLHGQPAKLTTTNWRCALCRLNRSRREPQTFHDPGTQQPVTRLTTEWSVTLYAE